MPSIRTISVSGSIPSITQLALGDLALNTYDGKAYIKKQQGNTQTVLEIGGAYSVSSSYAISASYALTASYVNPLRQTVIVTGSLNISGSGTLNGCSILTSCQTGSFYTSGNFGYYGAFSSTSSQTNPDPNISRSMQLETVEHSYGVTIVSGSRITVANPGVYNLQFSAQLEKSTNGVDTVYIWFKKNGSNIARSNTAVDVLKQAGGSGRIVAAWNYVDTLIANDYLEIIWQSADTTMLLSYTPAVGNFPSIPPVIATLTQVNRSGSV
tara:strand:- start:70 stop:873 length:804 start_codon:yes stop_codon:yes gene_type:complete